MVESRRLENTELRVQFNDERQQMQATITRLQAEIEQVRGSAASAAVRSQAQLDGLQVRSPYDLPMISLCACI